MFEKWKDYELPTCAEINNRRYLFNSDYKAILEVLKVFSCPDLLQEEQVQIAFEMFYADYKNIPNDDIMDALEAMMLFIACNKPSKSDKKEKPLVDWEKDFNLIVRPINKILGHDLRIDDIHWWTFMSYFMEIGESTFQTYVGIRDKKNRGKKLDKQEEEIFKRNREDILLSTPLDAATMELKESVQEEIRNLLRKR